MFFPMARSLRAGLTLLCAAGIILATGGSLSAQVVVDDIADPAAAKKGEAKKGEANGIPEIGEVPDGTPEELLAFIDKLQKTNFKPTSRQQAEAFLGKVAKTSVTVADKILDQTGPKDEARARAARMKLQSLTLLARLGDRDAEATLGDFAESLVSGGDAELAAEAAQIVLVSDAQKILKNQDLAGAESVVSRINALLEKDPDDGAIAQFAMQFAGALEHMPEGSEAAGKAYAAFGGAFVKSSNPQIKAMGEGMAGMLRRLGLVGNEMEIRGTNLDGQAFDQKTLDGKVVLVDFWATWCGPCIAEMPNVLAAYEKYHDKGFEVVGISLDTDRDALEAFLKEKEIPWTILFEQPEGQGWQHPLAAYYGITGIPTVILVGRDGKVVSMDVRGEKLGEELAKIFKDAK
jgi:thiol-disulfide isomerase/thioredoxin